MPDAKRVTRFYMRPTPGKRTEYFRITAKESGLYTPNDDAAVRVEIVDYRTGNVMEPPTCYGPEQLAAVLIGTATEISQSDFVAYRIDRVDQA